MPQFIVPRPVSLCHSSLRHDLCHRANVHSITTRSLFQQFVASQPVSVFQQFIASRPVSLFQQFIDRLLLILMPVKYQPDYMYLRHVPLWRVHLFTFIQLLCVAALWVVKSIKSISIVFPLLVSGTVVLAALPIVNLLSSSLPGAWRYSVRAGTGGPGVSIL